MIRSSLLAFVLLIGNLSTGICQPAFVKDSLDRYIEEGMKDWNIPGLAISIVKDGRTVYAKGFGFSDVRTKAPVDTQTLFIIASNTKLITGTVLANLQYQKKLSLDDKVIKYQRDFRLYDAGVTSQVTLRDLLSHRLGLKTFHGDLANWNTKYSRADIIRNMRQLKPVGVFRQDYGYSNSAFVTAGEILPLITGKSWSDNVQSAILTPLSMTNTYPIITGIDKRKNVSKPYTDAFTGVLTEIPYDQIDNLGPAGGTVSNVSDMSKWLLMQLDSGRHNGRQVLPWEVLKETRRINTIIQSEPHKFLPSNFLGYGLGVVISDYAGKMVYRHTGGVMGFLTNTCFVPAEKLGIVIMTNNDNQNFYEMLRVQILDAYLGVSYTNRSKAALPAKLTQLENHKAELAGYKDRVGKARPSLDIKLFEGKYFNELDGAVTVQAIDANNLKVTFDNHVNLSGRLSYMDNNEWLIVYDNIDYGFFKTSFAINGGKVSSLSLRVSDFVDFDTYVYTKKN
jgi:CubicO group peptidase (beta-lactamase class C family)